jgi:methylenetetrahydrofolate reductase (NADPH)
MGETETGAWEDRARFEVLPLKGIEEQAARLPRPVRLTVTCSPVRGPDHAVEVGARLRELGHAVTVHVAARMVRDRAHVDALLKRIGDAGGDLFLIGGDVERSLGEYSSAVELMRLIAEHPQRPRAIGIAGYPEDHPLIADAELEKALTEKSRWADYVTTQMCFDPEALRNWLVRRREQLGMTIPVLVGMPGCVGRRQLLKISARIGVGPSIRFVRKQPGLRSLLSRRSTADRLYDAVAPMLDDPRLNVAGLHYFTFNELVETGEWHQKKLSAGAAPSKAGPARGGYVQEPGEMTS